MRCRNCHYELAHLPEHRCPECGRGFDPNNPRTFRLRGDLRWPWWKKLPISIVLAILIVWLWFVNMMLHNESMRGGWFDSPRGRVFIATIATIAEWWWMLIAAVVIYLLLSSVGWVQVWRWKRRTRAARS